jgi:FkbM family methyltransferase
MSGGDDFLRQISGVVHVGANTGQERDWYRHVGLRVVWIEPIQEVFEQLTRNISGFTDQRAFCALITDVDDAEYEFKVANNEGQSSSIFPLGLHRNVWPEIDYVSRRTLRSTRLDTLFWRERLTPQAYPALVLDVQGAELLVLKGAGSMLSEFLFVKAEAANFESYAGGAQLRDLQDYLSRFAFEELDRNAFAQRPGGGTYWDIVWQRKAKS